MLGRCRAQGWVSQTFVRSSSEVEVRSAGGTATAVVLTSAGVAVYSSTALHEGMRAADGAGVASGCWAKSMEWSDAHHSALFDLDQSIQTPAAERGANDLVCLRLTGFYHNMIRAFAEI